MLCRVGSGECALCLGLDDTAVGQTDGQAATRHDVAYMVLVGHTNQRVGCATVGNWRRMMQEKWGGYRRVIRYYSRMTTIANHPTPSSMALIAVDEGRSSG